MPTYEYRCQSCGRIIEDMRKMADSDIPMPCSCDGVATRIITSPPLMVVPYGERFMNTTDKTVHGSLGRVGGGPKTFGMAWEGTKKS